MSEIKCNIKKYNETFIKQPSNLSSYDVDQCTITRKRYLSHLRNFVKPEIKKPSEVYLDEEWYPYCNSFYPFTEDVDALARVNHLLTNKPSIISLNNYDENDDIENYDDYCEKSIQTKYLLSNPVSFIILGKPGCGEKELGKQLADYWNCVYIEPETLLQQEIETQSRAGQCIEFNLRCGRAIGIDVILRLVEKRVKSQSVKHRGFVLCGLPLIPNQLYKEDPISSESAVFTAKEIFDEFIDTVIEIGVPPPRPRVSISSKVKADETVLEEEEAVELELKGEESEVKINIIKEPPKQNFYIDIGSTSHSICDTPEIAMNYEEQLNFIFNLLQKPYLMIYIKCPTADVITKRDNYRYDIYSNQTIDLLKENANKLIYNLFSKDSLSNEEIPEELFETITFERDSSALRHLVKLPSNFPAIVQTQLDQYHYTAVDIIERRVMLHDPQYYLKLDGRTFSNRMFNILKIRLKVLPLQKVILPEKLNISGEVAGEAGESGEIIPFQIEGLGFDECFEEFRKRQVASNVFKWTWSDWGTFCPVSIREGTITNGDPNFAVHFMNRVFFLANENAFYKFYRNPRPYLLPPCPQANCKIFVFGPQYSGKTTVSKCLSYLLNGKVLCEKNMKNNYLKKRDDGEKERMRQTALAEGMEILNKEREEEWKVTTENLKENIDSWYYKVQPLIYSLFEMLKKLEEKRINEEMSFLPMKLTGDSQVVDEVESLKAKILLEGIPSFETSQEYEPLLEKEILLKYLPEDLRPKSSYKTATVFDSFVVEYADEALKSMDFSKPILDDEGVIDMYMDILKEVEENNVAQENFKGGWVIDDMTTNLDLLETICKEFLPEDVIFLEINEPMSYAEFKLMHQNVFRDFKELFLSTDRIDAAWRCPQNISTTSFKSQTIMDLISDILDVVVLQVDEDTDPRLFEYELYKENLSRYPSLIKNVIDFFKNLDINCIQYEVKNDVLTRDMLLDIIDEIEDKMRFRASVFTEKDRAEEVTIFGDQAVEDEMGEADLAAISGEDKFEKNRRYGDTYHFCPVTLKEKNILWKGKEDFAVKFMDKLYLLSSEENMNTFLKKPREYLNMSKPHSVPPIRICIVSCDKNLRYYVSHYISHNLGLAAVEYENMVKDVCGLNSDNDFDEIIHNPEFSDHPVLQYILNNIPLPEEDWLKIINPLYFSSPFNTRGFILNDFPKKPCDLDLMIKFKTVPFIIINLIGDEYSLRKKILEDDIKQYIDNISHISNKNETIRNNWLEQRKERYEQLLEEKRESRYARLTENNEKSEELQTIEEIKSQVSFDSVEDQEDIDAIMKILDEEFPEPVFQQIYENIEQITEFVETYSKQLYELHSNDIAAMNEHCLMENITWIDVNVIFDEDDKFGKRTAVKVLKEIEPLLYNNSLFERVYDVSIELADRLLTCGYYFLSKFGKTCPVQYHGQQNSVQMYFPLEQQFNLYPVIYRSHIYYISGKNNLDKFKIDTLKYVSKIDFNFPLIPYKISVIGPPKSGKTSLAKRFKTEYGFKYISRGQAVRYVLMYLHYSELAKNMESVLRKGWELTDEMVIRAVEAATFDSKAVTQGCIFDGFPNTVNEVRYMTFTGIIPHLVVDLEATEIQIMKCSSAEKGKIELPLYSSRLIRHMLEEWRFLEKSFRLWLDKELQNISKRKINNKWYVWKEANTLFSSVAYEIKHYFKNVDKQWPLRLTYMSTTPLEFLERRSMYMEYCPVCLFNDELWSGGEPPDRTGVVQYKKHFYWLCSSHIELFLISPDQYLAPYNQHKIPDEVPERIKFCEPPKTIYENGNCIVCYVHDKRLVKGSNKLAVRYRRNNYIFDDINCLNKFLRKPMTYGFEKIVYWDADYPSLNYEDLPNIGLLEQYVATSLIKSLIHVNKIRPIIPGLSISVSALVCIGLHLKLNNDSSENSKECDNLMEDSMKKFERKRTKLMEYIEKMKSIINPYIYYDEPIPSFELIETPKTISTVSSSGSIEKTIGNIITDILDGISYDE